MFEYMNLINNEIMKKFTKYILALAAFAFATVSCVKEDLREESPADNGDCYGVYFPSQEVLQETQVFVPEDEMESQILVRRSNANGKIVVPVKVTTEHEDIFAFPDVVFEDGQKETYFTISFPDAVNNPGTTYSLSMSIEDPLYASYYSKHSTKADFSCLVEKWNLLTDPNPVEADRTPATFSHNLGGTFFGLPTYAGEIELYQNDLNPNKFRVKLLFEDVFNYYDELVGGDFIAWLGEYYAEPAQEFDFEVVKRGEVYYPGKSYEFIVDRDDFVDFDRPIALWLNYPGLGPLYAYPQHSFLDWPDVSENKVLKWQTVTINEEEVQIPAAVQFVPSLANASGSGWSNSGASMEKFIIIFPGQNLLDYSVELTPARDMEDGAVPVDFELGADVDRVLYGVFEGELSASMVESKVEDMMADMESLKEVTASGTELITCEETGKYTVIALSFAAEEEEEPGEDDVVLGEGDEDDEEDVDVDIPEVMSVAYASFGFTVGDDDTSVQIKVELTATDRNKGVEVEEGEVAPTAENSLEFFIHGTDIKMANMGLFKANHITYDEDFFYEVIEDLKDEEELFDEETVDLINSEGFTGLFEGLVPGTEYVLVVYAYNGYTETVEFALTSTDGDYNPILDLDINITDLEPITEEEFASADWSFFARTSYNSGTSVKYYDDRELVSDEMMLLDMGEGTYLVDGMFKPYAEVHEFDSDYNLLEYNNGLLYYVGGYPNTFNYQHDLSTQVPAMAVLDLLANVSGQYGSLSVPKGMIAGKIADGAIAFVPAPGVEDYISSVLEMKTSLVGFQLSVYTPTGQSPIAALDSFLSPIFVDQSIYDVTDYKPSTSQSMSAKRSSSTSSYRPNLVESFEGARISSLEAAKASAKPLDLTYHLSSRTIERESTMVDFSAVSVPFDGNHQFEIREIGGNSFVEARR